MMAAQPSPPSSHPGILHYVPTNISAFEPTPNDSSPQNTLLWIGGMFDTLLSVSYPLQLSRSLPTNWTLWTASLNTAGKSWGVGSVAQDAADMAKITTYIRQLRPRGHIVLMGHSTGCQDCMEYLVGGAVEALRRGNAETVARRPLVQGVILQAPVSDREALEMHMPAEVLAEANSVAAGLVREGREREAMPYRLSKNAFGRLGITARRWLDVTSPGPEFEGADDYFSSDLGEDRLKGTFGKVRVPMLILHSGADEEVPPSVDKSGLVQRWKGIVEGEGGQVDEGSGVVQGASHNLEGCPDDIVRDLVRRVVDYIGRIDGDRVGSSHGGSRI